MNRYIRSAIVFTAITIISSFCTNNVFLSSSAFSQESKEHHEQDVVTKAAPVTFKGEVICLGCSLKKEQGAKAQCSIYGHQNVIKSEDGKIWTILENDVSTELISSHGYVGKEVEIIGKHFGNTQTIEIETFKVIEE